MEFKMMTMTAIAILWAVSIQSVVAPAAETQLATLGDETAQSNFRKLLDQEENFKKVVEVLKIAVKNTKKAKKKAENYAKGGLGDDMKTLLEKLAKYPIDIGSELGPKVAELHTKLDEEYKAYRTFVTPFTHFVKKCGYMFMRGVGISAYSLSDLVEAFEEAVREGRNNYRDDKGAGAKTEATLRAMQTGADHLRKGGKVLQDIGNKGLEGEKKRRKKKPEGTPSFDNGDSAKGAVDAPAVEPKHDEGATE